MISIYDLHALKLNSDKYLQKLSEIYEFFTEGFDTEALIGAKARLKKG
jgi:hypothetical protein